MQKRRNLANTDSGDFERVPLKDMEFDSDEEEELLDFRRMKR